MESPAKGIAGSIQYLYTNGFPSLNVIWFSNDETRLITNSFKPAFIC